MKTFLTALATVSLALSAGSGAAQDFRKPPAYGTVALRSGFTPDPHRQTLQSGGPIDAERLGGECRGFVADAPDYRLNWTAGSGNLPLVISVTSRADTTLVVNGPDGRWHCNDDGGNSGLNPSVVFRAPASGQYDIWVGTYGGARLEPASLSISELYSD